MIDFDSIWKFKNGKVYRVKIELIIVLKFNRIKVERMNLMSDSEIFIVKEELFLKNIGGKFGWL